MEQISILELLSFSQVDIQNCTFADNFSPAGSIIFAKDSIALVNISEFYNNLAIFGGGFYLQSSTLTSHFSIYKGNTASYEEANLKYNISSESLSRCLDPGTRSFVRGIGGVIVGSNNSIIIIRHDMYDGNKATWNGRLVFYRNCSVKFHGSIVEATVTGNGAILQALKGTIPWQILKIQTFLKILLVMQ